MLYPLLVMPGGYTHAVMEFRPEFTEKGGELYAKA